MNARIRPTLAAALSIALCTGCDSVSPSDGEGLRPTTAHPVETTRATTGDPADDAAASVADSAPTLAPPVLTPPTLADEKVAEYAGLHNVVAYGPALYSGGAPEGAAGLESLAAMGIRTVISVDGAVPDVETAKSLGLRYVHLPIGYDGFETERGLEIARAVRDLPGPVYIHCHHGKHRSAGAAGAAAVRLGILDNEAAVARMHVSGTAANYEGLFACVESATLSTSVELDSANAAFPEVSMPSGMVEAMIEIDEIHEHLKAVEKAGWAVPATHPDLVPMMEAARLHDLYRNMRDLPDTAERPEEFRKLLGEAIELAHVLEDGLSERDLRPEWLGEQFKALNQNCKACHSQYRD